MISGSGLWYRIIHRVGDVSNRVFQIPSHVIWRHGRNYRPFPVHPIGSAIIPGRDIVGMFICPVCASSPGTLHFMQFLVDFRGKGRILRSQLTEPELSKDPRWWVVFNHLPPYNETLTTPWIFPLCARFGQRLIFVFKWSPYKLLYQKKLLLNHHIYLTC